VPRTVPRRRRGGLPALVVDPFRVLGRDTRVRAGAGPHLVPRADRRSDLRRLVPGLPDRLAHAGHRHCRPGLGVSAAVRGRTVPGAAVGEVIRLTAATGQRAYAALDCRHPQSPPARPSPATRAAGTRDTPETYGQGILDHPVPLD